MTDLINTIDWSRAQFALTAMYHWLFVPLTLGLGIIVAIMESIYVRKKLCPATPPEETQHWLDVTGCASLASTSLSVWPQASSWNLSSEQTGPTIRGSWAISLVLPWLLRASLPSSARALSLQSCSSAGRSSRRVSILLQPGSQPLAPR